MDSSENPKRQDNKFIVPRIEYSSSSYARDSFPVNLNHVTWNFKFCLTNLCIVGESFSEKSFDDWVDYWTLIFPKVTPEAIVDYAKKYHGSKEERDDLIELYNKHQGDMDAIMDSMILAEADDEDRIRKLIEDLLAEKVLEPLDAFVNEPPKKRANRLKRALKEANDCSEEKKKTRKEGASTDSLVLALQANQKRRLAESENLLDKLTEKYCKPQAKRKTPRK
ncbi:unnamed protein product [Dibothriocephalus latus]|uniref:DNAJC9 HTH domain-containing protein n=1 Tax=Dibothriocephalus latus TaxID=60516 RepID=A0A3P7P118_DIBLA|nr:unnamed protein product [Dibothriocephalus latus]